VNGDRGDFYWVPSPRMVRNIMRRTNPDARALARAALAVLAVLGGVPRPAAGPPARRRPERDRRPASLPGLAWLVLTRPCTGPPAGQRRQWGAPVISP
jgi:hypothetical protein